MESNAQRLQAPSLLLSTIHDLLAAIERGSPDAAYWYARTAAATVRVLEEIENEGGTNR